MQIELKELTISDGIDIFEMIKEIGPGENGFVNNGYEMDFSEFTSYLQINLNMSRGINLKPEYVPQTIYWLVIDNKPIGIGKLRHYLNDNLRKIGGHIGYSIRPSERGKGFGSLILKELLVMAKEKGINEVFLTCDVNNIPSRKVIESNSGELEGIHKGECKYWIRIF